MNEFIKRLAVTAGVCLMAFSVHAQVWTVQDSLHLKKMLESDQELHLNQDAIKLIDLGNATGTPRMSSEKSWLLPDESLPQALPKAKIILTLMPYTANTRFNWDPIYQKKIRVNKHTWRGDPFYELRHQKTYSNWAATFVAGGVRKSLDEIRASGSRLRQLSERANGMFVNSTTTDGGIPLKNGITLNGGTISGVDLMAVFTKDFWGKKANTTRNRTLEVLKTYGDSTAVSINAPVEQITR